MEITEVRIKLMDDPSERLKAFCSITFDGCFVVRDMKIIEGANGTFVAMPSRKLSVHCSKCHTKNPVRANYCNQCGCKFNNAALRYDRMRIKLYADIAHPINSECREMLQNAIIHAFEEEKVRALQPDYVSSYDDYDFPYSDLDEHDVYFDPPHPSSAIPHHSNRVARVEQV
ncbi:MAG: SpoVG family protein [Planctomycetaceae bacterium]|jgi:stage V sporulation protein G|nr:SpoVG family protein [Planctomycetaceae bacterium]